MTSAESRVLITGSSGYVGRLLLEALAARVTDGRLGAVVGTDVRQPDTVPQGATFVTHDVRETGLAAELRTHRITCVVHLASIVTPGRGSTRAFEYSVDVEGTERVLEACVAAGVRRLVVTSSGAAYGYHADNPAWLTESHPLRGNREFAYSWHKRLVEELLARARTEHAGLEQVIFRVGTILGPSVNNQITALFERPRLLALRGSASPFVFIYDADLVALLVRAVDAPVTGVFNVAGDGAMTIDDIAHVLGKPVLRLPAWAVRAALTALKPLGLTRYGPEQVNFLRYRPVLDNARLKAVFGFRPRLSSREAFDAWASSRALRTRRESSPAGRTA
ncbi:MAG: SDR family oxidoreductase [Gemmatimonadaceae bacterium]|nr:SDR family oxidoreductase [Gemmatimonadaceae bacterium]